MNSRKILLDVSAVLCFLCIAFFFPSLSITLLGGFVGFTVCTLILAITNVQEEVLPNIHEEVDVIPNNQEGLLPNITGNIIASADEEIIGGDDYNLKGIINQTQTRNISKFQEQNEAKILNTGIGLDTKFHANSEQEDELLPVCSEVEDGATKIKNLVCPSVTKSSKIETKFNHVEDNVEDALGIHAISSNHLENVAFGDISDVSKASSTNDEMSTGHFRTSSMNPSENVPGDNTTSGVISDVSKASSTNDEVSAGHHIWTSSSNPSENVPGDNTTSGDISDVSKASSTNDEMSTGHHFRTSSMNPLENVPGDNTTPVLPVSFAAEEVSTGYLESSTDLDANLDEVRTAIAEEISGNMGTEHKEDEPIRKAVSRKYPLDTVPMEFLYPCLPYFQY